MGTSLLSLITGLFICFPVSPNSLRSWCLINSDFLIESSISSSQFGFIVIVPLSSNFYIRRILRALECNKQLDTIILDIRKAFDTVPHDVLLLNLWNVGVTGSLWTVEAITNLSLMDFLFLWFLIEDYKYTTRNYTVICSIVCTHEPYYMHFVNVLN